MCQKNWSKRILIDKHFFKRLVVQKKSLIQKSQIFSDLGAETRGEIAGDPGYDRAGEGGGRPHGHPQLRLEGGHLQLAWLYISWWLSSHFVGLDYDYLDCSKSVYNAQY